jgi:hypothetical protein
MSLECFECERDLRGPHNEDCSLAKCECGHMQRKHDETGHCFAFEPKGTTFCCECKKFRPKQYEELD